MAIVGYIDGFLDGENEYSLSDTTARTAITNIKDGTNIDSFSDVETALDGKVTKDVAGGVLGTDGSPISVETPLTLNNGEMGLMFGNIEEGIQTSPPTAGDVYSALALKANSSDVNSKFAASVSLLDDTVGWIGGNELINLATTGSQNGANFTVNADKSVLVNTPDKTTGNVFYYINDISLPAGEYVLCGCPEGGADNTYSLRITEPVALTTKDFGEGAEFTLTETTTVKVRIVIGGNGNVTVTNKLFKPMILKKILYALNPSYRPHHESVEEYAFPRSEQVILGAENLLRVKNTTNTSTMTQVRNADDSVTLNGTNTEASGLVAFALRNDNNYFLPKGRYRLLVKTDKTYTGRIVANVNATISGSGVLLGSGDCNTPFEFEVASSSYPIGVYLSPYNNSACNNVTFYALLTLATDTNTVYQKPTFTNRELTEKASTFGKVLTSSDDLNNIKESGIYAFDSAPTNSPISPSSNPEEYAGLLVMKNNTSGFVTQVVYRATGSRSNMYVRSYSGSWNPWFNITGTVVS